MRTTAKAVSLLLLFLSLALTGCVKRQAVKPPIPPPEPYRGPVDVEVLKSKRAFEGIASLNSEVKAGVYKFGEKEGNFKGFFAYRYPNNIRLKLLSPIGLTAMEMVIGNGVMQVYVPHKNVIYQGPAPRLTMPRDARYGMEVEDGGYVLYAFRPHSDVMELVGKYSFQKETLQNTGVTVYQNGQRYMGIMLGEYLWGVPTALRLTFFNGYAMDLELQDFEVDKELPDTYFSPIEPGGTYTIVPLRNMLENGG